MTEPAVTVDRLVVPASVEDPAAGAFLDMVRIGNAVWRHDAGHADLDRDVHEALGFWQDESDWTHLGFAASRDGAVIGIAELTISKQPGTSAVDFDLLIDPDRWGEGAEEVLLAAVEDEARRRGLRTLQTWTLHRPEPPADPFVPTTGWGAIPAGDRQTVLQRAHGYALEQIERNSAFDLRGSFDAVERMRTDALAHAGDDYRVLTWSIPTPDEYLDGFAYAISRMSTDAPQGGLAVDEQRWDADRVRRREARLTAQRMTVSVAAAVHVPTGAVAAYNELVIGDDRTAATQQYGTLVLREHRGRRLGALVKTENLLRWRELVPESPRVTTFNAEENRPMLSINEALGFVPVSYAGAWQKSL